MKSVYKVFSKVFFLVLLMGLIVVSSCKDEDKKDEVVKEITTNTPAKASEAVKQIRENDTLALNPIHGKPGHRCDIKVGAPLNSASTNTEGNSPLINNSSNSTTGKLNPAHGQPGHRCDINVGEPL